LQDALQNYWFPDSEPVFDVTGVRGADVLGFELLGRIDDEAITLGSKDLDSSGVDVLDFDGDTFATRGLAGFGITAMNSFPHSEEVFPHAVVIVTSSVPSGVPSAGLSLNSVNDPSDNPIGMSWFSRNCV
jgi:hypothetical protein